MIETFLLKAKLAVAGAFLALAQLFTPASLPEVPYVPADGLVQIGQLGSAVPVTPAVFETSLASPIGASDTSMTLTSGTMINGNQISGYMCFTVDSGQPNLEYICGTASSTSVTSLTRGIDPLNGTSSVASLKFSHRRGANVKVTDYPALSILGRIANGLDGFSVPVRYDTGVATSSIILDGRNLVSYSLLQSTAFQGATPATTANLGLTKMSVAPVSAADPISVGDNDTRVPTQAENDALVGSFGSPSSTNTYVTSLDATSTPTAGRIVRFGSDGSVSGAAISGFVGNGTDGASTTSAGTSTLSRDVYYTNLTVATGTVLVPNGYRIFVSGTLTVNGTISINGGNGGTGGAGSGASGGSAGSAGTPQAPGSIFGGNPGAIGATGNGNSASATTTGNVIGQLTGAKGGTGGVGGNGAGGGGGGGTSATSTDTNPTILPNVPQFAVNMHTFNNATWAYMKASAPANGGGGGGLGSNNGGSGGGGGGGGGGGASGGIISIYAKNIVIGSAGIIQANGGNGGTGGAGATNSSGGGGGGGGGGAGGNGGVIVLVYGSLTNNGSFSVTGGTGGSGGALGGTSGGGTAGSVGLSGNNGLTGVIYQIQL